MATTQSTLERLETNLDESIGARRQPASKPRLSPVPSVKDVGRRPLRNYGAVRIDQVIPDPSQPRDEFAKEAIDSLAKSIKKKQLAPIRVRWSSDHDKWIIICGERRWRAAKVAKLETIECYFVDGELTDAEILEEQLVENLLRENLSPIEQARGFSALMDLHNWNGKQVAEALRIPASTVSRALALLDLPVDIQGDIDSGRLAARSAYEISRVDDEAVQRDLAQRSANGMTLAETQVAVSERRGKKKPGRKPQAKKLEFFAENGWRITAIPPKDGSGRTYDHLKEAIDHVIEDVDSRIKSNVRID